MTETSGGGNRGVMVKRFLFAIFVLLLGVQPSVAQEDVRRLLLLVDYVGSDYAGAVREGTIIDPGEYQEMLSLTADALSLSASLPSRPHPDRLRDIRRDLKQLRALIEKRGNPSDVSILARRIKNAAVALYGVETFPLRPPSMDKGRRLYNENCAECHGKDGGARTAKAKELKPPPANLRDPSVMEALSPFKAYNVLSFGIPGTAMASFDALSEEDRWNLAFYVFSLRFTLKESEQGKALWERLPSRGPEDLKTLSSLTDGELLERLAKRGITKEEDRRDALAYLRVDFPSQMARDPLAHTLALVQRSSRLLKGGKSQEAYQTLLEAYLEGFELVEPDLEASHPGRSREIEGIFTQARNALKKGADLNRAAALLTQLRNRLAKVQTVLAEERLNPRLTFFNSLVIILREGMEAALIVAAILAFLRTTGQARAMLYIHLGWLGAIVASLLTWLLAESLISLGGTQREFLEALTSLLAAAVLFYVSYWLLAKLEVRKWKAYIDAKIRTALSTGHLVALSGVSFLAVYREGFETVLFYEALLIQSPSGRAAVFSGFVVGAVLLLTTILALFKIGVKIPLRYFFGVTSGLLYFLAVIFTGQGIYLLQQLDLLHRTPLDFPPFPTLGIYSNAEGLIFQGGMLVLFALSLLWVFVIVPRKAGASRKA